MLNKISSAGDSATVVALVGGHSIASAVLQGNSRRAIIEALTISICILILWLPEWLKGQYDAYKRGSQRQMPAKQRKVARGSHQRKDSPHRRRAWTKSLR